MTTSSALPPIIPSRYVAEIRHGVTRMLNIITLTIWCLRATTKMFDSLQQKNGVD